MNVTWLRRVVSIATAFGCLLFLGCDPMPPTTAGEVSEAGGFVCGPFWSMHNDIPPHFVNWSSAGTQLTFDDDTSVLVVSVDGMRLRQIVDANPGYRFRTGVGPYAQFSPDGQAIVYASCEYPTEGDALRGDAPRDPRGDYKFEIAKVSVDGTGAQRRTTDRYFDHLPVWSPDGRRIAYLSSGNPYSELSLDELRVLSVDSVDAEPVALVRALYVAAPPQWAPDGTQLAVLGLGDDVQLGDTFAREMGVVMTALDSSTPRTVAHTVSTVSWSPDGQRLALARLHQDAVQLVTIAPDGTDVHVIRKLTDRAGLAAYVDVLHSVYYAPLLHVAWSPDGSHLLYSCGQQFCVVDLDGELVGRTPEEFARERGRAATAGATAGAAAWAPDGSRVAVRAAGNPTPNGEVVLYTMAPDGSDVRVLVRGGLAMVAEHSGYQDAEAGRAACREGYVVPNPEANPGLVADCETLMAMRDTLAGPTIVNWGAGTPLEQWVGVQISGEPLRVTGLWFEHRDGRHGHESHELIGRLPPAIGDLDQLRTLDLSGHTFFDEVPRELERLRHLRELNLWLYGGARLDGCLSAAFVEQLEVAEGVWVCAQESSS